MGAAKHPMITVAEPVSLKQTYARWRWQIFAVTWLAYAGFYLTRKSFSVAKIEIGK
ncbi:MAG: MFS transporter, partial [Verrucomicrobiota bacterium]